LYERLDIYDQLRHVQNSATDGIASVGLGVAINDYIERDPEYDGNDVIRLNFTMTANSRKYITYDMSNESLWWIYEEDLDPDNKNVITEVDDWGAWINIPLGLRIRFYGGPGSGEYTRVWVCSNGFIAFDISNSTSPTPSNIPNSDTPNAIIAALWTDLDVDESSSIVTGVYNPNSEFEYFVIIWKNVLHEASLKRLTFQIALRDARDYADSRYQSDIWINYASVSAINTSFTVGIEDHEGVKGHSGLYSGDTLDSFNERSLVFYRFKNGYFLAKLTLSFYDTSTQTRINIREGVDGYWLRGYNIPGYGEKAVAGMFLIALSGTAVLLLGGYGGILAPIIMAVDTALVTLDWVEAFATLQYSGRYIEVDDYQDGFIAQANATASTYVNAVDASMSLIVHWILDDPGDEEHALTITATIEYYEITADGNLIHQPPLSTSIALSVKPDSQFDDQTVSEGEYSWLYIDGDFNYDPEDNYYVYVEEGNYISAKMTPALSGDNFDLYLYDPNGRLRDSSELGAGQTEEVCVLADISGNWRIKVDPMHDAGFYSLKVDISPAGGCPILYVLNSSAYVYEGLLNIHNPNGTDVIYRHTLVNMPQPVSGVYLFRLVEHPQTISYIDQVKLYAIIEDNRVPNNRRMIELLLIWAWHSEHGNVLPQLLLSDDWRIDTLGAKWNNGVSQSINLKFVALPLNVEALVFKIEGNNPIVKL
jgi:hypothetical protein